MVESSISEIRLKQLESKVAKLESIIEEYSKRFDDVVSKNSNIPAFNGDIKLNKVGDAVFVSGKDTYKYKEILKEMGGKWEKTAKCWVFPSDLRETLVSAGIKT